jgi:SsrA-binding protein
MRIAPWAGGNRNNHEPMRDRKLLLRRTQIDQLVGKTKAKGLTMVPLSVYINDRGKAKVQLGIVRGKRNYDRRRDIAARDARRDMDREISDALRGR